LKQINPKSTRGGRGFSTNAGKVGDVSARRIQLMGGRFQFDRGLVLSIELRRPAFFDLQRRTPHHLKRGEPLMEGFSILAG
jgi:hypothetical protein